MTHCAKPCLQQMFCGNVGYLAALSTSTTHDLVEEVLFEKKIYVQFKKSKFIVIPNVAQQRTFKSKEVLSRPVPIA